jgi:hypothetical protein
VFITASTDTKLSSQKDIKHRLNRAILMNRAYSDQSKMLSVNRYYISVVG